MGYVPKDGKLAKVITLPEPEKPMDEPVSYRPISSLAINGRPFKKQDLSKLLLNWGIRTQGCSQSTVLKGQVRILEGQLFQDTYL